VDSISIRNIPEDLMTFVELRARVQNCSPEVVVVDILQRELSRLSLDEWLDLVATTPSVDISTDEIVSIVRKARESR
jgi:plasmid stability protein